MHEAAPRLGIGFGVGRLPERRRIRSSHGRPFDRTLRLRPRPPTLSRRLRRRRDGRIRLSRQRAGEVRAREGGQGRLSVRDTVAYPIVLEHRPAVRSRRSHVPNSGQRQLYRSSRFDRRHDDVRSRKDEKSRRLSLAHAVGLRRSEGHEDVDSRSTWAATSRGVSPGPLPVHGLSDASRPARRSRHYLEVLLAAGARR